MARDPRNLGNELGINIEALLCPQCDSALADIVDVLAPEEVENQTQESWGRTVGGATVGGTIGALGGPVGVGVGAVVGSVLGNVSAQQRRKKRRTILRCSCGYRGPALPDNKN